MLLAILEVDSLLCTYLIAAKRFEYTRVYLCAREPETKQGNDPYLLGEMNQCRQGSEPL